MSFRAVWIAAKSGQDKGHLLLSRKYATVERRFILINRRTTKLPEDNHIIKSVFEKLQIGRKTEEFIEEVDGCQQSKQQAVISLEISGEKLWPVIAIQKFNLVFACLCLVEKKEFDSSTPLVEIPAISIGYALLHNMVEFLELVPADSNAQLSSQVEELGILLKILMPFGTPTDTNFSAMKSFLVGKDIGWLPKYRLSAWRPLPATKAKNQFHFTIREHVNAVIYNDMEKTIYKDMCCVYGTVSCKADIEGVPEVSMNLVSKPNIHIAFHPCLQSVDIASNGRPGSSSSQDFYEEQMSFSRNVRFTPPNELFPLCHINGDSQPPVNGGYQMKTEREVIHLKIHLRLNAGIKNSFEYFEIHIPFFHRGPVSKWDYVNSWGTILISPEKRKLVWSLGQKFPKSLQISLKATVLLADPATSERSHFQEDPFCQGNNTYIQIYFKSSIISLSGITIDPKSIKLNPSSSPKVHIVKDLVSSDYKIWNSHGDALVAFPSTI